MAKITQEQRNIYQQKIKYYKNKIEDIKKVINALKTEMIKSKEKEPGVGDFCNPFDRAVMALKSGDFDSDRALALRQIENF